MNLQTKFIFGLVFAVVAPVFFTTLTATNNFASTQETLLKDFQTRLTLSSARQLSARLDLLHAQLDSVLSDNDATNPEQTLRELIGSVGLALWDQSRIIAGTLDSAPPIGRTAWSLVAPNNSSGKPIVRWVGRFGKKAAVIDFDSQWFDGVLEKSVGGETQVIAENGLVLFGDSNVKQVTGRSYFHNPELISRLITAEPNIASTKNYRSVDSARHLGTFLVLNTEPRVFIAATTPWSLIEKSLEETYKRSLWLGGLFFVLAVVFGVVFSTQITKPLKLLSHQVLAVAKGRVGATVPVQRRRKDEVGVLNRAFNIMSRHLQKTKAELQRKERLATLGTFSAAIAHEIKNPLGAIIGNTQAVRRLLASTPGNELIDKALKLSEEEALRANRIINDLMKFARQDKPPTANTNLTNRLSLSMEILQPELAEKSITLTVTLTSEALWSHANEDQIHEVLGNLIYNARDALATTNNPKIEVRLSHDDDMALISVADNGPGMSAETKKHLFEPFFTTKPIGKGTGLGLATCSGIIRNHRGSIRVVSQEGHGTTFEIRLPLIDSRSPR